MLENGNIEFMRSPEQELTFEAAKTAFARYGVEFGVEKFRTLGLVNNDNYTNLGLLLSDQCAHTTKIAVFNDAERTVFRDSKEFGGSIFKQFEDTINYLALCNKTSSVIKGVVRTDTRDYHEEAIREALLNALVHRDYGFSGSIIINVNDDKMEFISIGGLVPGLTTEDIRLGISQPRNKKLAEIFHRLRLIESYGTGIRRIFKLYESCSAKPEIEVTQSAFKIVLPNMNETAVEENASRVTNQMRRVLDYIDENGKITEDEIGRLLGVKRTRIFTLTKEMRELGLINAVGRGDDKRFVRNFPNGAGTDRN